MFLVKNNALQNDDNYVVGIGASAGGLEAINELFDHGVIIAKGKENEGAVFTIVLPADQPRRPRVDEEVTKSNQI